MSLNRFRLLRAFNNVSIGGFRFIHNTTPKYAPLYHAGLKNTEFTNDLLPTKNSQIIPIFRVLDYEGNLEAGWELPFPLEELKEALEFMIRLSVWDDMFYNIQRQGRISFYIQNMGEEGAQTGIGKALTHEDMIFGQYRELGVLMLKGFTLDDVLNQLFGKIGDPSKGRQMPISYCKRESNIQAICTPLTTQVPHAAGAGYGFKMAGEKRAAVAFFGEGAASEGDFHAAMNFAAVTKSQTMFICRNNGYAISTPVKDQYAGDGIAIRGLAYGMETVRVDGNDLLACYIATKKMREICVENSEPVLLECMTYRMGHHSTSDDSSQYRPDGEYEAWNQPGVNPIARIRKLLVANKMWETSEEEELRKEAKKLLIEKIKKIENNKSVNVIEGVFDDVYDKREPHIQAQAESLKKHLSRNINEYNLSTFDGVGN
eukprot:GHVL01002913.1.p1 GENE.GHVL01002913.1~~GHVL01002913.1.p1  ORF type:complete len:430 (+),score=84.93 GHVL01002913.1:41-1330(+)